MPEQERLRVRAVAKARDYLMAKIYLLRRPKTNIQILQQNLLLKCGATTIVLIRSKWDRGVRLRLRPSDYPASSRAPSI